MKTLIVFILFGFVGLPYVAYSVTYASEDVCFTPPPGCEDLLVGMLDKAKVIRIQEYEFTSNFVLAAVLNAKNRKADIEVILDKDHVNDVIKDLLVGAGI